MLWCVCLRRDDDMVRMSVGPARVKEWLREATCVEEDEENESEIAPTFGISTGENSEVS